MCVFGSQSLKEAGVCVFRDVYVSKYVVLDACSKAIHTQTNIGQLSENRRGAKRGDCLPLSADPKGSLSPDSHRAHACLQVRHLVPLGSVKHECALRSEQVPDERVHVAELNRGCRAEVCYMRVKMQRPGRAPDLGFDVQSKEGVGGRTVLLAWLGESSLPRVESWNFQ